MLPDVVRFGVVIYFVQSAGRLNDEMVWPISEDRAILLLTAILVLCSVSREAVIGIVPSCYLGEEWAWILCKRVKSESIDDYANHLKSVSLA